jgi:hypothetical protein
LTEQFSGLSRLPIFLRQLGKSVKSRQIGQVQCNQAFQLLAFCLDITPLGSKPDIELMKFSRS